MPGIDPPTLCPCKSGLVATECCFLVDVVTPPATLKAAQLERLDEGLAQAVLDFAQRHFGDIVPDAAQALPPALAEDPAAMQLLVPWALYDYPVDGYALADWFLDKRERRLRPLERSWLRAQIGAYLSVWLVREVDPARSVLLQDLLTLEEREVFDVGAASHLAPGDALLARVVDCEGVSVLRGVHPHLIGPHDAETVVKRVKRHLKTRRRRLSDHLVRDAETSLLLLDLWQAIAEERILGRAAYRLQNTDGEDLLVTSDRYRFDESRQGDVLERLLRLPGVERDRPDDEGAEDGPKERAVLIFTHAEEDGHVAGESILGRAVLEGGRLVVETNSLARADRLRERIEEACGDLVRHRARVHEDPLSEKALGGLRMGLEGAHMPNAEALRRFKEQHYRRWPDIALPALGGKTPRDAVRRPAGRRKVEVLIRDFEHREARLPKEQRVDFRALRKELGLDEG